MTSAKTADMATNANMETKGLTRSNNPNATISKNNNAHHLVKLMLFATLALIQISDMRPLVALATIRNLDKSHLQSETDVIGNDGKPFEKPRGVMMGSSGSSSGSASAINRIALSARLNSSTLNLLYPILKQQQSASSVDTNANRLRLSFTQNINTSLAFQQQQQQQHQHLHSQLQEQRSHIKDQERPTLLKKVCIGTSTRLSSPTNRHEHYQSLVERYTNCTYVIGNLEITWLDRGLDLGFLSSIQEITGHLLIAFVKAERFSMPSLQIIRGRDLFKLNSDQKEEFALALYENDLGSFELPNLREILAGSVCSVNNKNLCHFRLTINWDEIINWPTYKPVYMVNEPQSECPKCDSSCSEGHCWGEGPELCQKFSKEGCSSECGQGRCFGTSSAECCHSFCAGGCKGPKQTDCFACKNYYDDGACVQECPSMMRYNPTDFLWEPNPSGKYAFGATCVKECPMNLIKDNGACVRTCPPTKRNVNGECVSCGGPCPKNCQGVEVVHSGNIDQLINCTWIDGPITISDVSFTGHVEPCANNATCTRHKPMQPSRLEVFKTLREITGSLTIQANHPDFKNLSFFENLRSIGKNQNTEVHSLSITRTSLVSLNLNSLRKVKGRILIEDNSDLCFADTIDWKQINNITKKEDISTRNNAESSKCVQLGLECHEQCAQDGCWGKNQNECLSCNNYKLEDYCVDNCTSTLAQIGSLSFDSGSRTCKKCHPECDGGCNGTEAKHCWNCKSVRDGPHCVAECPSHKYNNSGVCEECDKSCLDGCTGPTNRLGEGGCNSCAKAIINSTDPIFSAYCIKAEDPCPEGHYQEYIGPKAEGPLKSSFGKPVCRRCHHRCKSCTGMGTHVSVCDCAKYLAGEQCEDDCPRDYFADDQLHHCFKCSPECNGCFGPTEADCLTCRVYRIYHNSNTISQLSDLDSGDFETNSRHQIKFNCTAQCPPDKPYRISEKNMLDPFCSELPGIDEKSSSLDFLTIILMFAIISGAMGACVVVHRCQDVQDKKLRLTQQLSGINDREPTNPSNMKPNLSPMISIKETELRKGKILGSGFGGTVYHGWWYPEGQEHSKPKPVAIKVLRDNGQRNMNKEFLEEAYIMASVKHPNLVSLLAVCATPKHLMLVTQLMPLGCLLEYVKIHRNDIGSKNLLEWSKQIARGMAYLEEHRMVHRDLALRNVLLQTCGRALISDFGLAKFLDIDQSEYHSGGGRLPIKWLAPECIRERKFTHKSDIWAFGVTVWELLNFGMRPFEEYETKDVPLAIEKGARLQQPSHMSAEVYKVLYACWFYNPNDRPDFKALEQNFMNFARDPERYLICGSKGIDYQPGKDVCRNSDTDENASNEYNSDSNSLTEEEELSPQPLSGMPELTPSTHNRLNEHIFHFERTNHTHNQHHHHHHHNHQHQLDSDADTQIVTTPSCKDARASMFGTSRHQLDEDNLFNQIPMSSSHQNGHTQHLAKGSLATDVNNNTTFWPVSHTMSTNSIGKF